MTEERIGREYYDSTAYFDDPAHLTDPRSAFQRYRVAKVLEIHRPRPDARVVDLGCGWGTFSFELAKLTAAVVGVDFSEKSIELCNRRLAREPMDNLRFVCADAGQTGLEAEAWDLVVAADLFEHLYPDDRRGGPPPPAPWWASVRLDAPPRPYPGGPQEPRYPPCPGR
jgi:2-polyprenyl-3-methyl-5-hydroxy-6-metoxy-1,4-benzoquinol methylase